MISDELAVGVSSVVLPLTTVAVVPDVAVLVSVGCSGEVSEPVGPLVGDVPEELETDSDVPGVVDSEDCDGDEVALPVLVTDDPVSPLLNENCDDADVKEPVVCPDEVLSEVSLVLSGVVPVDGGVVSLVLVVRVDDSEEPLLLPLLLLLPDVDLVE